MFALRRRLQGLSELARIVTVQLWTLRPNWPPLYTHPGAISDRRYLRESSHRFSFTENQQLFMGEAVITKVS